MPVVCICSLFRDSATRRSNELLRYFVRMGGLDYPFEDLRFSFVEGDSKDNTYQMLKNWVSGAYSRNCILEKYDTNTPYIGSAIHLGRFKVLSTSANKCLDNANNKWGKGIEWYLWLESDIHIDADLIRKLIHSAEELTTKFLSPMIYLPDGRFYDIYAFIDAGRKQNFRNDQPYHPDFDSNTPMKMFSVGSIMLMHRDVIESGARWEPERCIVDLCANVNKNGFEIWLDPRIRVLHP